MGGRPAKLEVPFNDFDRVLKEAKDLYTVAKPFARRGKPPPEFEALGLGSAKGRMIVGLAFLRMMGAWEVLLEEVFLRFMIGTRTKAGATVAVLPLTPPATSPTTIPQAFRAVHKEGPKADREKHYLSWTQWQNVTALAAKHFAPPDPFTTTLRLKGDDERCMKYANAVRNRVAHNTPQTRAKFKLAVLGFLGGQKMGSSFMPGDLLMKPAAAPLPSQLHGKDVFLAYAEWMRELAVDLIA
jgi:hypothetical protein